MRHRTRFGRVALALVVILAPLAAAPAANAAPEAGKGDPTVLVGSDGSKLRISRSVASKLVSPAHRGTGTDPDRPSKPRAATRTFGVTSIIGDDDRYRITPTTSSHYPASAVVQIQLNSSEDLRCTGFLIGVDTVATAGHCVYEEFGGWKEGMVLYPGNDGISQPFGYCFATALYTVEPWFLHADSDYDYGAIKLSCRDVGDAAGWFGYGWTTDSLLYYGESINGYPKDKPLEQWGSTDIIRDEDEFQLHYENDTEKGDSGAPVYTELFGWCYPCAIAIHTYGTEGTPYNSGTRITRDVFDFLQEVTAIKI